MRILLDECIPKRLARFLTEHEVTTTPQAGWAGIKNGELLRLASKDFDAFVTVDRNLAFQQNISNLPLPVIVILIPKSSGRLFGSSGLLLTIRSKKKSRSMSSTVI